MGAQRHAAGSVLAPASQPLKASFLLGVSRSGPGDIREGAQLAVPVYLSRRTLSQPPPPPEKCTKSGACELTPPIRAGRRQGW